MNKGILTYTDLCELCDTGTIEGVPRENVNGASIDIVLGDVFWIEDEPEVGEAVVYLSEKKSPKMVDHYGTLFLPPGGFCLAQSREVFNLPNDIAAEYKLKSSLARSGLDHLNAGWADPGWHGSVLTFEFHNVLKHHWLALTPGMKAGQMVVYRGEPVPDDASYAERGSYNHDMTATRSKGLR